MSIQSNINNTIGQAAMLATLNPAIQEMGETAKDKSKFKNVEKQLDTLQAKSGGDRHLYNPETGTYDLPFSDDRALARYNQLRETHEELAGKLAGKGIDVESYYRRGMKKYDYAARRLKYDQIEMERQKAEEQRARGEALKQQKIAEEEAQKAFRSKQIRDLIMNPNLEVNNGTGNDTRR